MEALVKDGRVTVVMEEAELRKWVEEQRQLGLRKTTLVQSNQLYDRVTWAWLRATEENLS